MASTNNGQFSELKEIEVTKVHGDLSQQIIQITVDKLSLILLKHAVTFEKRKAWITPLGIFVTILIVLLTSTFKEFLCSAETWSAIFIISAGLTFLWLVKAIVTARKSESIEDLIEKIKQQS
ncbi:MAG: hypothetical protein PF574_06615 [Candidatus Delongbacteria bacterium]|jgi:hypothetical protein|nr:hypothetical protein [Candidatus Delongbacteria bacterium]